MHTWMYWPYYSFRTDAAIGLIRRSSDPSMCACLPQITRLLPPPNGGILAMCCNDAGLPHLCKCTGPLNLTTVCFEEAIVLCGMPMTGPASIETYLLVRLQEFLSLLDRFCVLCRAFKPSEIWPQLQQERQQYCQNLTK